ncbi:hypothetical protein AGABI1DRAFT_133743 [Agaricus bisporus var. burnettii JB137-S8]|uniref:Uncharacterized protein n=1 Tax=Agaricus bisporus var. burnettii (strain JB137-S8 / ATCC MYA-4627 / FGSC 10392) TaxID=597362 RepID=K5WFG4_AGABU|nr:uncharacterized protein AGABI1DRAFT_133743 [Agaricus bisporus var. burnettii JB137-S8]EKM74011.1 hypothetical protein AGABI1DRAFT_133743 [Agaricus bisporus var. burnettii JB137-S8]
MTFASLPFELVVRICRLNAHRWQTYPQDVQAPLQDTMAASQVCSHWRSIVLSAPELWRFAIDPYHPCASWRDLLPKRSEPLSIEFIDVAYAPRFMQPVHDIQLQMQSGMHQRLRRYDIWLAYKTETTPIHSPLWPSEPGSWSQLRRLGLFFDNYSSNSHEKLPVHFPGLATPILEHLTLTCYYMPDWNELRTLGNTLTHLKIYHPPSRLCADRWIELIRNLPNLEKIELSFALEAFCDHPHSKERFTLGVKKFSFADLFHCCPSFLDRIDLSSTKCRSSSITCLSNPQFDLEIPAEDAVQAVLPRIKRLLSQIAINNSRLRISDSFIVVQSGFLGPAVLSNNLGQTVIAKNSNHFFVCFDRHRRFSTFGGPLLFPALLDIVRPMCASVELAEASSYAHLESHEWEQFFDVLVHCQHLRFMQGVGLSWWNWLCKLLMPAASEVTNDATEPLFPHLRSIGFEEKTQIKERLVKPTNSYTRVYEIPFDELKAFSRLSSRAG